MPSCTPPCLFFRPCRNFSNYVGIFPTMSHFQGGIFPTMSEFFPQCRNFSQFPSYMLGKIPSLLMEGIPDVSDAKKTLWVAVKIFLYLLRESSVICKAIFRKSAETLSFFYSVYLP